MIDILIASSSHDERRELTTKISGIKGLNLCSRVRQPSQFFEEVEKQDPDVVLTGIDFENISGLDIIDKLMSTNPKPILVINDKEDSETVKSFSYGAIDFISPEQSKKDIKGLIEVAAKVDNFQWIDFKSEMPETPSDAGKIIVIGASTGGPGSLETIISKLPEDFPAPVLVAQHMSEGHIEHFASRLNDLSPLNVKKADHGDKIEKGNVLVSPADKDMLAIEEKGSMKVRLEKPSRDETPSIDRLFTSVSEMYRDKAIGVVLSGMGRDGVLGARYLKSAGSTLIVQNEKTCAVYGIGSHVEEQGDADKVLPIQEIPTEIVRCL